MRQKRSEFPETNRPTTVSHRHPLATFFALAYGISWLLWAPLWLPAFGVEGLPIFPFHHALGALGPIAAAFLVSAAETGRAGPVYLLRRMGLARGRLVWVAVALLAPFALLALAVIGTSVFVVWLLKNIAPAGQPAEQKRTHRVAFGLAVGLGVLGLAVSIALPIVLPVFRLPHPSGPYEMGTLTYHWVDANRPEVFSADSNARRELMVQIWYPAKGDPSSPRARYVQDADALAQALARLRRWPGFTFAHLRYVTSNAISSAAVSDDKPRYLVLIFMEGLARIFHRSRDSRRDGADGSTG